MKAELRRRWDTMRASGRNDLHLTGWNESTGIGYGLAFENFVSFHISNHRWLEVSRDPGDGSFTVTDHDFNEATKEELERCRDTAGLQMALVANVGALFETMQLEEICAYAGFLPGGQPAPTPVDGVPHQLGLTPTRPAVTDERDGGTRLTTEDLRGRWNAALHELRGDLYLTRWNESTHVGYGIADPELVQFQIDYLVWVSIDRARDGTYEVVKLFWHDTPGADPGPDEVRLGSSLTLDGLRQCLQAHLGAVFDDQQLEEIRIYSSFLSIPRPAKRSSRSRSEARTPEPEAEGVESAPAVRMPVQSGAPRKLVDLCARAGLRVVGDRLHDNGRTYWAVNDDRPFVGGRYVVLIAESGVTLGDLRGLLWTVDDLDAIRGLAVADRFSAEAQAFAWGRPIQLVDTTGGTEPEASRSQVVAQTATDLEPAVVSEDRTPEPLAVVDVTDRLLASEVYVEQREAAGRHAPSDDVVRTLLAAARGRGGRVPFEALVRVFAEPEHAVLSKVPMLKRVLNVDSYDVLEQDPEDRSITVNWELLQVQFEIE